MALKKRTTTKTRSTSKKRTSAAKKHTTVAQKEVAKEMRRFKKGTAVSGRSEKKVTSRKQAIAIGLSKARKKGAKVPAKRKTAR